MSVISNLVNQGLVLPCQLYPIKDLTHAFGIAKYLTRLNTEKETTSQIVFLDSELREDRRDRIGLHAKSEILSLDTEDNKGDVYDKLVRICRNAIKADKKLYMTTLYLVKESIPFDEDGAKTAYSYIPWTGKKFEQDDLADFLKLGMVMYRMALLDLPVFATISSEPIALIYHWKQKGNNGKINPPHVHLLLSI